MTRISLWLSRFANQDRLKSGTSTGYRYYIGYFALAPACVAAGVELRRLLANQSHPALLWLALPGIAMVLYIVALLWARSMPVIASLSVGLIAWTVGLWLVLGS